MMTLLMTSLNYWWLLLALFLGLWGFAWSLSVAKKRKKESGDITPIITVSEQFKQKVHTTLANMGKIGLGMVLGVLLGMGIRDRQLINNRFTYTAVTVSAKVSNFEFLVWPDRMKQQHVTLCPESPVGWYAGEILDDWTFEQRNGCKHVISYHEKPQGEINASIQMR